MKKTIDIDLSSDRLIAVAADLVDEHNYISALKLLNKNADMHFNDEDSYMLYAVNFRRYRAVRKMRQQLV